MCVGFWTRWRFTVRTLSDTAGTHREKLSDFSHVPGGAGWFQTLWAPAGVERRKALPFHRHLAGVFTSGQQLGTVSEE